ncbi:MAG TPA: hypothetical protein PLN21_09235, partial [Gemmatales bacterium]|nr:hypothetical protein [Gemmatales bacterium]
QTLTDKEYQRLRDASIAVPQAANGEFPWLAAGFSLLVATFCILATLRNLQLFRRFRQQPVAVEQT